MFTDPAQQLAVDGWVRYILAATADLAPRTPLPDRLAQADLPELPEWLSRGIWTELVAWRGQALVELVVARAGTPVDTAGHSLSA